MYSNLTSPSWRGRRSRLLRSCRCLNGGGGRGGGWEGGGGEAEARVKMRIHKASLSPLNLWSLCRYGSGSVTLNNKITHPSRPWRRLQLPPPPYQALRSAVVKGVGGGGEGDGCELLSDRIYVQETRRVGSMTRYVMESMKGTHVCHFINLLPARRGKSRRCACWVGWPMAMAYSILILV